MNRLRLLSLLVASLVGLHVWAQNIQQLRTSVREAYLPKHAAVAHIALKGGTKLPNKTKLKQSIYFSRQRDTIIDTELRPEGQRSRTFVFDTQGRVQSIHTSQPGARPESFQTQYRYDAAGLKTLISTTPDSQRIEYVTVQNDAQGNPVKLTRYDAQGVLSGFETAVYNYNFGTWVHEQYDAQGKLGGQYKLKLKPSPPAENRYNEQGDCTLQVVDAQAGKYLSYQYKYDVQGNWIAKKVYAIQPVKGKPKKKKAESWKRKIRYY